MFVDAAFVLFSGHGAAEDRPAPEQAQRALEAPRDQDGSGNARETQDEIARDDGVPKFAIMTGSEVSGPLMTEVEAWLAKIHSWQWYDSKQITNELA